MAESLKAKIQKNRFYPEIGNFGHLVYVQSVIGPFQLKLLPDDILFEYHKTRCFLYIHRVGRQVGMQSVK
jgi:hypothetical protein